MTGERARWFSAVLIVAAIAAVSAIVRVWPVNQAPAVASDLVSRPLYLLDAPAALAGRIQIAPAATIVARHVTAIVATPGEVERVAIDVMPPAAGAAVALNTASPQSDAPPVLLASRTLDISVDAARAPAADADPELRDSPSHGIVELPAVVVSRAFVAAGRGIKTGVRATSAIVRAAF